MTEQVIENILPDQLYALLEEHRAAQEREREHAGTVWQEGGWMFAQEDGRPIDPRRDYAEWKQLLKDAGVREAPATRRSAHRSDGAPAARCPAPAG